MSSSSSILTRGTHRPRIALIGQINPELRLLNKRDICAGAQSLGIELLLSSVAALVDPAKWQGSSSGDGLWCCWVASQAGTLHWGLFSLSGPLNSPRSQLPKLHCSFNKGTKYAPEIHFKRWAVGARICRWDLTGGGLSGREGAGWH